MTPYDKANDELIENPKPSPTDPGEPKPRPSDPGDEIKYLRDFNDALERSLAARDEDIEQRDRRIVTLTRYLDEAHRELAGYRERERQILDLIQRTRRQEAYARLHQQVNQVPIYPEGLGGVGQCDCTMSRSDAIQQAIQTLRGT